MKTYNTIKKIILILLMYASAYIIGYLVGQFENQQETESKYTLILKNSEPKLFERK